MRWVNMSTSEDKPPRRVIALRVEGRSLSAAQEALVGAVCAQWQGQRGALLPIFHGVQAALGYVPKEAVPRIARELNLSVAEVHGTVSFYHYFRSTAPGRHVVHLCRAEACQAVGGGVLEAHAKRALGIDFHGTTADGAISLEPVYCLGNCALGPALLLDAQLQGRVSTQRFDALLSGCRAAAPGAGG
jgi:formate dehydrogenase subunit gamma